LWSLAILFCGVNMDNETEQELRLAKASRDEWMAKWRHTESRVSAVWNDAIMTARLRLGHHEPKCLGECVKCWFYDEMKKLMRGEPGNYMPVKERMGKAVVELKSRCVMPPKEKKAYLKALDDLSSSVEKMLSENE
jgi:hypothetical protein